MVLEFFRGKFRTHAYSRQVRAAARARLIVPTFRPYKIGATWAFSENLPGTP